MYKIVMNTRCHAAAIWNDADVPFWCQVVLEPHDENYVLSFVETRHGVWFD